MKKLAASIRTKLLQIATKENISYQNIQTIFLLERMVARLTKNKELFNKIIFKGGYVGQRVYNSPRHTIDLDALIKNAKINEIRISIIDAIENNINDGTWFKYEKNTDLITLGEYGGTRLYFRCGIGEIPIKHKKSQSIHFDIACGDVVIPKPVKNAIYALIDENIFSWMTYTIESTIAEKLHTLIIRGSDNSRSKDVFDLYNFLPKCDISVLKTALFATFSSRGDSFPVDITPLIIKINRDLLEMGWKNATAGLVQKVNFDDAFELILMYCDKIDSMK